MNRLVSLVASSSKPSSALTLGRHLRRSPLLATCSLVASGARHSSATDKSSVVQSFDSNKKPPIPMLPNTIVVINKSTGEPELKFQPPIEDPNDPLEHKKPQWERNSRFRFYYGLDSDNEANDKGKAYFLGIMCLMFMMWYPIFMIWYTPDKKLEDWCFREAHLELARREKAGEPLVSPDYLPVDQIKLPSEEEIGDLEIYI